jgi:hypothetical protein
MGSVPGTIVWPTPEQRRAGREPVMARIVHRSDRRYSAAELWAAVRPGRRRS